MSSSDWQFARREGTVVWTSPALPNGGQPLYTVLSPTLMMGYKHKGEIVPHMYIEFMKARAAFLATPNSVQIDLDGKSILLVCNDEQDGKLWLENIRMAIGTSEYDASSFNEKPPAAKPHGHYDRLNQLLDEDMRQYRSRSAQSNSNMNDSQQQQRGSTAPPDSPQPSLVPLNQSSSASARPFSPEPSLRPLDTSSQPSMIHGSGHDSGATHQQHHQQPSANARPPIAPTSASAGGPSSRPLPFDVSEPSPYENTNHQQQQQASNNNTSYRRPSFSQVQLGGADEHTTSTSTNDAYTSSHASSFQRPIPGANGQSMLPPERPPLVIPSHPKPSAPSTSNSPNPTRPLAHDNNGAAAANTFHQHQHQQVNLGGGGNGVEAATPNLHLHSRPLDGNPQHYQQQQPHFQQQQYQPAASAAGPRPMEQGMSHGRMALDQEARNAFDRLKMNQSASSNHMMMGTGGGPGASSLPPMGSISPGGIVNTPRNTNGAGRRSMIVDVPASQHVNRSIAPNPSAMWKQWEAPDGNTYFCHEPTGTLQLLDKKNGVIETVTTGTEDLTPEDLAARPKIGDHDTVVDIGANLVSNLSEYGAGPTSVRDHSGINTVASSDLYRQEVVKSPRGQFSPTRRTPVEALAAPRLNNTGYQGKRLHRVTLMPSEEDREGAVVEHAVESLQGKDLVWDKNTGKVRSNNPEQNRLIGNGTIYRQWEHVRKILMQGRYFKKHSARTNFESYRFVFLTSDNSYVASVPTSEVMMNISEDPMKFGSVTDTIQYYSPDSRSFSVNDITHVSMGTEEDFVYRKKTLEPENTFVIVTKKKKGSVSGHALILECQTSKEAKLFCDAWNFFLYYSRPMSVKERSTPAVAAPVTHGTRGGAPF